MIESKKGKELSTGAGISKTSTDINDLPFELKELISFYCDYFGLCKLRSCSKTFKGLSLCKTVGFQEYQILLKHFGIERWQFQSDFQKWEEYYWVIREKCRNDGVKSAAFQQRIHLDLSRSRLSHDQYLYVCRNGLVDQVCRIVKTVLDSPEHFYSHINLAASNANPNLESFTCIFSLAYAIIANDVEMCDRLIQRPEIDPSTGDNLPIRLASRNGLLEIVQLLVQDPRVYPGAYENDAIILACRYGKTKVAQFLLQDDRVDPSVYAQEAF